MPVVRPLHAMQNSAAVGTDTITDVTVLNIRVCLCCCLPVFPACSQFVEGLQQQPDQSWLLPYQGSAGTLYPDMPALGQPHAGSSSNTNSSGNSTSSSGNSSSRSSRSPSPLLPLSPPSSGYQPAVAAAAVSKRISFGAAFSKLWKSPTKRQSGMGATSNTLGLPPAATASATVTAGGSRYAAATAPPAAATAPNDHPGMSLLGLTQGLTSGSDSCQLPGDVQAVLDTAKHLPDSPADWQAFGRAVQLSLCCESGLSLNLMGQQLTDEQVEALASWSAPFWPMLQQLDLSGNCISSAGECHRGSGSRAAAAVLTL